MTKEYLIKKYEKKRDFAKSKSHLKDMVGATIAYDEIINDLKNL
ncbi:hypothetical protein [Tenacibaculum singaporense]|nr:hypothetical protein [Tenacibaculum singaporense]